MSKTTSDGKMRKFKKTAVSLCYEVEYIFLFLTLHIIVFVSFFLYIIFSDGLFKKIFNLFKF